ncbi:MAG TPA: hypothetical protein VK737_09135 [Opitutales bacterium]|jgi:hypothetical protein|nr:hypothetical protein [Opitutales bacterium]
MDRREFIIKTGLAAAGGVVGSSLSGCAGTPLPSQPQGIVGKAVTILVDPADPVATSAPAKWAVEQLRAALSARQHIVNVAKSLEEAPSGALCIVAAGRTQAIVLDARAVAPPNTSEALAIAPGRLGAHDALVASGADARGLMYALTEIADAVAHGDSVLSVLPTQDQTPLPLVERPANKIRSVMRMFVSDVEDKAWYNDRDFWRNYLTTLATQRFNRFNLAFGLGYDSPSGVRDTYFYFAYPFLLSVPGYNVTASNLPDTERDDNLAMLRFISDEAAARGLEFQLGLWTHAYNFPNSPNANHTISGLNAQTQAPYSRDALAIILKECPNITGVTFRIHGESGVPEGNYDLWKTIFDGLVQSGRRVELDMHAKGMDQQTIDVALGTGLPVVVSPKFSAEHMGLPYHQASIRQTEMPTRTRGGGAFAQSNGARSFLRYSYGDLLTENSKYGILHRMWPGTQRVLQWGDPVFAAAYSRAGGFCGSLGQEIFDPLSFKGRKGSGLPGGRDGYKDLSLRAPGGDFEKYAYTLRVWGRMLYTPSAQQQSWQRPLRLDFYDGAGPIELSLAHASRILPLVTTAHLPSAANNNYWPEMYENMSIVEASSTDPYTDTPAPKRFGTVSPLDPQLFLRMDDYVDELLKPEVAASGKYTPIEVAQWLENLADTSEKAYSTALNAVPDRRIGPWKRYALDVTIQIGLGRFFAKKFRASVLYSIFTSTGNAAAFAAALHEYNSARKIWSDFVDLIGSAYVSDMTYGDGWFQRGNWADRLALIDQDIKLMSTHPAPAPTVTNMTDDAMADIIKQVTNEPSARLAPGVTHISPLTFHRGTAVPLVLLGTSADAAPKTAKLYYRHAQQAESWNVAAMQQSPDGFHAEIPASYTDSAYALIYYFELQPTKGRPTLFPGFNFTAGTQPCILGDTPYLVLRQTA